MTHAEADHQEAPKRVSIVLARRFWSFLRLLAILTALMFGAWYLSAALLPKQALRPYFSRLFAANVGEFTFWRVLLANLLPFLGLQFMNLTRAGKRPAGLYVLPLLWILVGVLYGTNSFVFAGDAIPFSVSVIWSRTGFNELLAYTLGYEASRHWALWEQKGLWQTRRIAGSRWRPTVIDLGIWLAGLLALILAVLREVH